MIGCLFGMFVYPFRFFKWCFTNGWKGVIVLVLVFVALIIGILLTRHSVNEANSPKPAAVSIQDKSIPAVKDAPYLVKTTSRKYYAVKVVKDKKGVITMTDYYDLINKKWTLIKGVLVLDANYGKVTLDRR